VDTVRAKLEELKVSLAFELFHQFQYLDFGEAGSLQVANKLVDVTRRRTIATKPQLELA
jgi:hypothetical protein